MAVSPSPSDDPKAIRMAFQRLCRDGANLFLRKATRRGLFPMLAESEGRIAVAISGAERELWGLELGGHLSAFFVDRGRRFEATLEVAGPGSVEGVECCHFEQPRRLVCLDDRRFADFMPHAPITCLFSTPSHDICEGRIRAMGAEGIELRLGGTEHSRADLLRVEGSSVIELPLGPETRLRLEGTVAYFREGMAGILFHEDGSEAALRSYRSWLMDSLLTQLQRDREAFNPGGVTTVRNLGPGGERPGFRVKLVQDRDPLVLVISEGDALVERLLCGPGLLAGHRAAPGGRHGRAGGRLGTDPSCTCASSPAPCQRHGSGTQAGGGGSLPRPYPDCWNRGRSGSEAGAGPLPGRLGFRARTTVSDPHSEAGSRGGPAAVGATFTSKSRRISGWYSSESAGRVEERV